ncbi:hypothetical protein CBS101457_002520 [Exobasidium rhododendri]|nr:hypothetical protein CBS101457_002520 [Exobasidium rhododendri]
MAATPRHDFYQTDSAVHISVYVKGCKAEDVDVRFTEHSLEMTILSSPSPTVLQIVPLYASVDPDASSFKVLGSKIEVSLRKVSVGVQWRSLQGEEGAPTTVVPSTNTNIASSSTTSSAAPRARSKWDSFKAEDEHGKIEEEAGVDDFFKKLYADADDDTRKAMMKSYQESGGTALSTNWGEVKKGKVETKPPEGMEARKY